VLVSSALAQTHKSFLLLFFKKEVLAFFLLGQTHARQPHHPGIL
jgi:hypothetical protein